MTTQNIAYLVCAFHHDRGKNPLMICCKISKKFTLLCTCLLNCYTHRTTRISFSLLLVKTNTLFEPPKSCAEVASYTYELLRLKFYMVVDKAFQHNSCGPRMSFQLTELNNTCQPILEVHKELTILQAESMYCAVRCVMYFSYHHNTDFIQIVDIQRICAGHYNTSINFKRIS